MLNIPIIIMIIVIIIQAVGVDQAHGAVGGQRPQMQTLQHEKQENLQKVTGGERR